MIGKTRAVAGKGWDKFKLWIYFESRPKAFAVCWVRWKKERSERLEE